MAKYDQTIEQRFTVVSRSGDERVCKCPWHDDGGKPNLYVNAVSGLYYCHVCGEKGSLARKNGESDARCITVSLEAMQDRLRQPQVAPERPAKPEGWLERFDFPHDHWKAVRGYSDATIRLFRLGYDPVDDLLTIPVRTHLGAVMGVITRRLDGGMPKYMNPTGFKKAKDLFGSWLIHEGRHVILKRTPGMVALVEGPLDAVSCWDANVPALAMHGAHISEDQKALLLKLGVRQVAVMTDNDEAGDEAVHVVKRMLKGTPIMVLVSQYAEGWGKDPGELEPHQRRAMFLDAVPYHRAF